MSFSRNSVICLRNGRKASKGWRRSHTAQQTPATGQAMKKRSTAQRSPKIGLPDMIILVVLKKGGY